MKYEELSNEIIEAVGGKQNIVSLQHCMTRLRFTLKDESQADDEKVRSIKGVLSLIKKGGQYQIVIGTYVHDVYLDICKIANIEEKEEKKDDDNKEKKNIINSLISTIIGVIAPIIPILIGTGLGKCLLMIVSMMGWANADTSMTYYIFNFVFDAGFTFLPVSFVALLISGSSRSSNVQPKYLFTFSNPSKPSMVLPFSTLLKCVCETPKTSANTFWVILLLILLIFISVPVLLASIPYVIFFSSFLFSHLNRFL